MGVGEVVGGARRRCSRGREGAGASSREGWSLSKNVVAVYLGELSKCVCVCVCV